VPELRPEVTSREELLGPEVTPEEELLRPEVTPEDEFLGPEVTPEDELSEPEVTSKDEPDFALEATRPDQRGGAQLDLNKCGETAAEELTPARVSAKMTLYDEPSSLLSLSQVSIS